MHGDFSRWTFDRPAGYRAVLLQQGRVLLDADYNEQNAITTYHDEARTDDFVGRAGAPAEGGGFAIVDAAGAAPADTAWEDLHITPGRFYVDGILAEAEAVKGTTGHPLNGQPHLRATSELPGLREPKDDGRYAAILDVWTHHVTRDEAPQLLESALGGPDTATRAQTVWQVRLRRVEAGESCASARDAAALARVPPTLTASLAEPAAVSDPCEITTASGYRRLENQLYRVEIHEADIGKGVATYKWSRENGSVVAGLTAIGPTAVTGMDAELTLDREGRDEELSIGEGDVVEVTSTDRVLHRLPGFLATAGAPVGLVLPIAWSAAAPANLDGLGRAPVVRRWEGAPRAASATEDPLEDGIQVAFGDGEFRTGDHWLIPARTVRLVYGATARSGTIEWPTDNLGAPLPQPPLGPVYHRATIALLDRTSSGGTTTWTLGSDCRNLFPPLTDLVGIDLLGGDGQQAPPGQPLPEVIRVAVRNGGLAVVGAPVRFAAAGGQLGTTPPTASPSTITVLTDARGHADVRWLLDSAGPATQVLTATLLDDSGTPVGAEVHVTGRLEEAHAVSGGLHVEGVLTLRDRQELENDRVVYPLGLLEGIAIVLDGAPDPDWANGKPVLRVEAALPWPSDAAQGRTWGADVVGTQRIDLRGVVSANGRLVRWEPVAETRRFLQRVVPTAAQFGLERVLMHVTLLGNVIGAERDGRYLNGRAYGRLRPDGTTALVLPSVDDVHGADFTMWFWLAELPQQNPPRLEVRPDRLVFGMQSESRLLSVTNAGGSTLVVDAAARTLSPPGTVIYAVQPARHELAAGKSAEFTVTSVRGGAITVFAGELLLTSNDPQRPSVTVPLTSLGLGNFGVVPSRTGVLRLAPVRRALTAAAGPEAEAGATGTGPLVRALADRQDQPRLRLAVAPGFEAALEELRERLARAGVDAEVEVVDGDPADLVQRAAAGDVVLDGVIGDEATAAALAGDSGRAVLPLVPL